MRADLATLTPEALGKLSNMGLVKRAQTEIKAGDGPTVTEETDGTVVAVFAKENVTAKLVPGKTLKDTPCSCGAKIVCRHRIAAVLVYVAGAGVETQPPWTISVEKLAQWLGARVTQVDAAEARGMDVELSTQPPTARFSGYTVRFLAGADLAHAACDCAFKQCVHIPLAVRAFQRLSEAERQKASVHVRLGPPARRIASESAMATMSTYLHRLLEKGLTDARGLDQARAAAQAAVKDCPWLDGVIEDLEAQRGAWENRSALHDSGRVRTLLMEGFARIRAARRGRDPAPLLGLGEPINVPLEKARLLSLGARISAIGSARTLEVLFWDGATVLSWSIPLPPEVDAGSVIGTANTPLSVLAAGQVTSEHLVRLARKTIEIRKGRNTQVIPQGGQWVDIPLPVGFSGPSALWQNEQDRPPWFLRHRGRTEALRVVATPNKVQGLTWSPGRQTLTGVMEDDQGGAIVVERAYEWFAPGAIPCLAETLPQARYLSGWLRSTGKTKVLEPIAVVVGENQHARVVVPDLAPDKPIPALPMTGGDVTDPLETVLARVEAALDTLAQEGVLGGRIQPLGAMLQSVGLRRLAETYTKLEVARAGADAVAATNAWADLAIALSLARG